MIAGLWINVPLRRRRVRAARALAAEALWITVLPFIGRSSVDAVPRPLEPTLRPAVG